MDQRKETTDRHPILKDLLYLFVVGCLFVGGAFVWKHFHRESSYQKDPEVQEKAERLTDH
jgi:hypothetical protein